MRLQLFNGGEHVRQLITVSFLIQNCYYCLHESRSGFFPGAGRAPTLAEYLPLNEIIPTASVANLDDEFDFVI